MSVRIYINYFDKFGYTIALSSAAVQQGILYKTLIGTLNYFYYKPDILRTLLRIAVDAIAQSLLLPAPSNQIIKVNV